MINKEHKFYLIHLNLQVVFQKAKKYAALFLPIEILERFSPIKRLEWIFPDRKY